MARTVRGALRRVRGVGTRVRRRTPWRWLSDDRYILHAYRSILRRDPDPSGRRNYRNHLRLGTRDREGVLDDMISSDEFRRDIHYLDPLVSLHVSRCQFVRSLPRARRILDLGGASQNDPGGALVALSYPYRFEELVIVDLPLDERHDLYTHSEPVTHVETRLGPVRYRYQSMTDFSPFADESFDLVYSGQTIEHVTPAECDAVLTGVLRVLEPGGWFAVDTPNGPVCRLHQADFINPDHKIEYSHTEFSERLVAAGFEVRGAWGLDWLGQSVRTGRFSEVELRENVGMFHEIEDCYLLAYLCRKPGERPSRTSPVSPRP